MRLVRKLVLAITLVLCAVMAAAIWWRAGEARQVARASAQKDQVVLGVGIASAVQSMWQREGPQRAVELVEHLNSDPQRIAISWLPPDRLRDALVGPPGGELFENSARSKSYVVETGGDSRVSTFVFVNLPDGSTGAIKIEERLTREREGRARIVQRWVTIGAILVVLCGALTLAFGTWFVAKPLKAAVEQARRIGAGDLTGTLVVSQHDEVHDLAVAMNEMCEQLRKSQDERERDIRKRAKMLQQLRHAERLSTAGALASGIAHQLGTPLNVIRVRGAMIAGGEVGERRMRDLGAIIVDHVDRVSESIQQLLGYARRAKPTLVNADVVSVVERSVRLVEPLTHERRVRLHMDSTDPEIFMQLDPEQIHQAVTNLIVNAVQASPLGGHVKVEVSRVARRVWIEVSDEGEGIPAEHLAHIFEPFYTTKNANEGTGLGLSVANEIVLEHRGMINVVSEPGVSTVFRIVLPSVRETSSIRAPAPTPEDGYSSP